MGDYSGYGAAILDQGDTAELDQATGLEISLTNLFWESLEGSPDL